jgi:hypothetical protein
MEPATKKYFPASNLAREVRDRLVAKAQRSGARVRYGADLIGLRRLPDGRGWECQLRGGGSHAADRVVRATALLA